MITKPTMIYLPARSGAVRLGSVLTLVLATLAIAATLGAVPSRADQVHDSSTSCQTFEVRSKGFWKNHSSLWLLPQTLGNFTVAIFSDAQGVFNNYPQSATTKLHGQLLALKFNIAYYGAGNGLVPGTNTTLSTLAAQADALLQNSSSTEAQLEDMKNLVETADVAERVSSCGGTPTTATLKVVKHVVNNSGGTSQASDFIMNVTGTNVSDDSFPGSEAGVSLSLQPGSYSVDESVATGYIKSLSAECSGTIAAGETKTCTVTNDDAAAQNNQCILTITKSVSSATANPGDTLTYTLNFKNTGTANCTGGGVKVQDVVNPLLTFVSSTNTTNVTPGYGSYGLYTASSRTLYWNADTLTPNETGSVSWTATVNTPSVCGVFDIPNTGHISSFEYGNFSTWASSNTVHTTGSTTCTGQLATLVVKKHVINNNGGLKTAVNFTMNVTGSASFSNSFSGSETGTSLTVVPGTYTVGETLVTGYAKSIGDNCSTSGSVTLAAGETKTCTVTNDDVPPPTQCVLTITKSVSSGTANPGNTLTYTLNFKNTGTANCTGGGGVKVQDVVDPQLTFVAVTSSTNITPGYGSTPLYTSSTRTLHWNADTLTPNETGSVSWTATVNTPTVCGTFDILNTGRITSAEYSNFSIWVDSNTVHTTGATTCVGQLATLVVKKHVNNTGGGTKTATDFTLHVKSAGVDIANSPSAGSETGTTYTVQTGTYTVSENAPIGGYINQGVSGDCNAQGSVTLAAGETKTCTITNASPVIPGTLIVKKHVINNNTGTKAAADFTLHVKSALFDVSGSPVVGSEIGTSYTLVPGIYTVSEDAVPSGYTKVGLSGDCAADGTITVVSGTTKTCTITNDDQLLPPPPGTLVVIKHVVNTHGGTKTASDFNLHAQIGGVDVTGSPAAGMETGTTYTLAPGLYTISEDTLPANYTQTGISGDCGLSGTVTVVSGATKTCTITNSDQTPPPSTATLLVKKHVLNTNAGTKTAANFNLHVKSGVADVTNSPAAGAGVGVSYTLAPGTYTVSEDAVPVGYVQTSITGDCSTLGSVTLSAGDSKTCTITNSDVPPPPTTATLIVKKHVINNNGGSRVANDFTMNVSGTNILPSSSFTGSETGTTLTLDPGAYSVDEASSLGYVKSIGADCSGTIAAGVTKTCTITNDDQPIVIVGCVGNCGGGGGGSGGPDCSALGSRVEPATVNMSIPPGGVVGSSATIQLTYGSDITSVILSNSDTFNPQSSVPLSPVVAWSLSSGSGAKTVYARFYNRLGCSAAKTVVTAATVTPPQPQVLGAACINVAAEAIKVTSPDMSVARKYSGRLVLQCQPDSNIAWYIDPSTNERFYLPPAGATHDVLKVFATPISNLNLAKIQLGLTSAGNPTSALTVTSLDATYTQAQKGKLFLQTEANSELWYVNPDDGKRYFIPTGTNSSVVPDALGQCIPSNDLSRISVGIQSHGTPISKVSSCYPTPRILGATDLPRTGFPLGILVALPFLAVLAIGFAEVGRDWVRGQ